MRTTIAVLAMALSLSGCGIFRQAKDRVVAFVKEDLVPDYCKSDEPTRQWFREQFSTEKGPLIEVHCDNLEDARGAGEYVEGYVWQSSGKPGGNLWAGLNTGLKRDRPF